MPFLRLETATPSETEQTIMELRRQLRQKDVDIANLKAEMNDVLELKDSLAEMENQLYLDRKFFEEEILGLKEEEILGIKEKWKKKQKKT